MEIKLCTDKMYELALELSSKGNEWSQISAEISAGCIEERKDADILMHCGELIDNYARTLMNICNSYNENEKNIMRDAGGII